MKMLLLQCVYIYIYILFLSHRFQSTIGIDPSQSSQLVEIGNSGFADLVRILLRVLGRGSENLREDRNNYVHIICDNIEPGELQNNKYSLCK